MAQKDELQDTPYCHGALPDEDADKMLLKDGDFLIQFRPQRDSNVPSLVMAVKKRTTVHRFKMERVRGSAAVILSGKQFPNVKILTTNLIKNQTDLNGDGVVLRRAIPKSKWSITHRDVRMRCKIGSGAYGTVYQGYLTIRDKEKNTAKVIKVATKRLDSSGKDEQGLTEMMIEARVMQMCEHVNIVKFYGYVIDRTPYLLVMELCQDGSVEDVLRKKGASIMINRRIDLATQAARGLEYLHTIKCIHRDIATRNCLLAGPNLKLADFGMCRATEIFKVDLSKPQNVRWLAPEVWKTGETNFTTDVYAFGIMIWELFEEPYKSPYSEWRAITVKEKVMNGFRMSPNDIMPDQMASVMRLAWAQEADTRPPASTVRQMLEEVNKEYNPNLYKGDDEIKVATCRTARNRSNRSLMSEVKSVSCSVSYQPQARTPARTPPKQG
ncbi:unnamed protein product [Bursaphelenchus okinawaensis]|uniref:Tyrosine-protein kinase n=1 Tax=Bursaphelenchus okinawaensis TaxID=465554 RepID=A0A811KPM9_9BILA|nr:unnamed protein product [Bursaphelenchus okinawaensis]CAG9109395.1 unnamed protein product [Bursaphelenchus okinawaensis]